MFVNFGIRFSKCTNVSSEIAILDAVLESPTTLNTNVQNRRFGVERLQIVFLVCFFRTCISCGPCLVKRHCCVPSIGFTFFKMYARLKRNRHLGCFDWIPHNAQHKCSKTTFWRGAFVNCVFVSLSWNLHFALFLPSDTVRVNHETKFR